MLLLLCVRVWEGEYREKLILFVTLIVVCFCGEYIERGTDIECYCFFLLGSGNGNIERN
jgi:hypothetical protein